MADRTGKVYLCKDINLDKDYINVLNYTEAQMLTLCTSQTHLVASKTNCSFIRQNVNEIIVEVAYGTALQCNYMAFQNPDYSNKWFFAFIDDVVYNSESSTIIRFTIDEHSTWFDYWDAKSCFVMREHVRDDTIGLHTLPEGLEIGDYVVTGSGTIGATYFHYTKMHVCIGTSWIPDDTPSMYITNRLIGGVFSGTYYLVFKTTTDASKFIKAYGELGHVKDIQCLYMIPEVLANITASTTWNQGNLGTQTNILFITLDGSTGARNIDTNISISQPTALDGYTPKNKKLLCSPFSCLAITNNTGTMAEFKYEDFISNAPLFSLVGVQTPSCPMYLFPKNYKKDATADSGYGWGIPLAKIPQGSWNADMYTNWMTQNGVNILGTRIDAPTAHAIMGSAQALVGAGTGQFDSIGEGLGNMFGATQELYRASMIPAQIGGQTTVGDVTFAYDKLAPTYYKMTVRAEYAEMCDNYLTKYGYSINKIKVPDMTSRTYYNYLKLGSQEDIGYSNTNGSVPAKSMNIINNIYRKGVTIWHSHDNIGNYSLNNTIVSS